LIGHKKLLTKEKKPNKMASFDQSFRHRTENPLPRALALRLTEERVAFKFRRQALVPETEDDQKLTFVP
jgi:hypothetical protein